MPRPLSVCPSLPGHQQLPRPRASARPPLAIPLSRHFVQQQLVLAGAPGAPQTFHMSQPGRYFNFDITEPAAADNAITGTLVSSTLNSIKSIVGSATAC